MIIIMFAICPTFSNLETTLFKELSNYSIFFKFRYQKQVHLVLLIIIIAAKYMYECFVYVAR